MTASATLCAEQCCIDSNCAVFHVSANQGKCYMRGNTSWAFQPNANVTGGAFPARTMNSLPAASPSPSSSNFPTPSPVPALQCVTVTVAGSAGTIGSANGRGTSASFNQPRGLAVSPVTGNVLVADFNNCLIREVTPQGTVTTLAGSGCLTLNKYDSALPDPACVASYVSMSMNPALCDPPPVSFSWPAGVAVAPNGDAYVADCWTRCIRKVAPNGWTSTAFGGGECPNGNCAYAFKMGNQDGTGTAALFNCPYSVALSPDGGTLFISDVASHNIRRAVLGTGAVTTLAGAPGWDNMLGEASPNSYGLYDDPPPMPRTRFASPMGLTVLANGDLLLADSDSSRLRRVTPTGIVTTLLGEPMAFDMRVDGRLSMATVNLAHGLAADAAGSVFVADTNNHAIRVIRGGGATVSEEAVLSMLAGSEVGSGDGTEATFNEPQAVALSADGNLYVMDTGNHLLRRVMCPSQSPSSTSTPSVTRSYTWSISPSPSTTPSTTPLYLDLFFDAASPGVNCPSGCATWANLAADFNYAVQADVNEMWNAAGRGDPPGTPPLGAARRCANPGKGPRTGALGWVWRAQHPRVRPPKLHTKGGALLFRPHLTHTHPARARTP
jgi:DNA-binding beta-propeller fold protein YncE